MPTNSTSLQLGIVIRKSPGVTKWARWVWRVIGVLPGAGPAHWKVLRREGDLVEYHAATTPLELWASDTEAYLTGLAARVPNVYVILRESDGPEATEDLEVVLATASPYEAQDYLDSGEEIVEQVAMPEGLAAFVRDFCHEHHVEETFVKRKRDKKRVDLRQDGIGDPRIRQQADVYRAPGKGRDTRH
ncbi:MAG: DUF3305 domain-containing protein [Albidovulum sp.]|nr:DUF3305 domain-containing protein [Albidovulum sp.]MDE0533124.1 DUF3305 domain-containing protein [Albidovulum sp.]